MCETTNKKYIYPFQVGDARTIPLDWGILFKNMAKQQDLFGFEMPIEEQNGESKYSKKVSTPIYTPSGRPTSLYECYDHQKYLRMIRRIDNSNVSEDEKKFLRLAATRHIVFNFERIADYYASASKEMQELMEKSALVIIDFDKAIEEGFVQLNDNMRRLYEQELD